MKIALFNPYSLASPETPLISLLASYVSDFGHVVTSLSCNGCFTVCDRRVVPESGLKRRFGECFGCKKEAEDLSENTEISINYISSYVTSKDLDSTFRWAQGFELRNISDVTFEGENILWLCRSSLKNRYGTVEGGLRLPGNEQNLRNLFLSAARMIKVGETFAKQANPDLTIISGRDFLAESFETGVKKSSGTVARFAWEPKTKLLNVAHPERNEVLSLDIAPLSVNLDILDPQSWPDEVHEVIKEIMLFLGIPSSQLSLFAANQGNFA